MSVRRFVTLLSLFALAMMPAFAQDAILSGVDLWGTPADGATFADFSHSPIPADFFCAGSRAFTGKIDFMGTPIKTYPEGAYGRADTVIQRLDDAYFNEEGLAVTRIQVRALSFAGMGHFATECGAYNVSVRLSGEQPITEMRIVKEHAFGGHFESPLDINVVVQFTPISGSRQLTKRGLSKLPVVEIPQTIRFSPNASATWSLRGGKTGQSFPAAPALVDTDNDGEIDTELPGTSNFAAGWVSNPVGGQTRQAVQRTNCHCNILLTFESPSVIIEPSPQPLIASTGCQHLHCPVPIVLEPVASIE